MSLSLRVKGLLFSPNHDVIIVPRVLSCSVFPSPFPEVLHLLNTPLPALGLGRQHLPALAKSWHILSPGLTAGPGLGVWNSIRVSEWLSGLAWNAGTFSRGEGMASDFLLP